MERLGNVVVVIAIGTLTLTAGCVSRPIGSLSATPASTAPAAGPAPAEPQVSTPDPSVAVKPDPLCPTAGVTADVLLRSIRVGHTATYDRVVFEFCGTSIPGHQVDFVAGQIHADPSDRVVPLHGQAFVRVVFHGATTDTAPVASDPGSAPRYAGPLRLSPDYGLLKELAIAGDFEGQLSFGIGVDHVVDLRVQELTSPSRIVIDFLSA